jgi:hypothetical protein
VLKTAEDSALKTSEGSALKTPDDNVDMTKTKHKTEAG